MATRDIPALKKEYLGLAEKFTPEETKRSPIFDLTEKGEIKFTITKKIIEDLGLEAWLQNYEKEAKVSTGGIRGPQNILYPWDTRFPINELGVALSTIGKVLVLKDDLRRDFRKALGGEVRYNTDRYIDLISRIQAQMGVATHLPRGRAPVPVWMISFLIFMLDFDGGEYITSSHAISSKIATKDLYNEGSPFLPEMSLRFVEKIKKIIKEAKENPEGYLISLSPQNSKLIVEDLDGYDLYVDYLKRNVARDTNLELMRRAAGNGFRLMCDTVGGCMYQPMLTILRRLGLQEIFEWRNTEPDPFFHGIGKDWRVNPATGKKEFFDYSCDFCLFDVAKRAGFEEDLKDKPIGYIVLITDPDGDRLNIGQIESPEKVATLEHLGIDYIKIDGGKIFVVYNPTFSFLLIMDFYMKQLAREKILGNHPRFIVVTAPSPKSWNEWAEKNGIKVVTTPVGIKEIATVIKKTEKQILDDPEGNVGIENIFGEKVDLGKNPRMIFGGEESGGMITGLEDFVESVGGRKALAMRDKSAGEAIIVATALASFLYFEKKSIIEYLEEILKENEIKSAVYVRDDIIYYNESEPDPSLLQREKSNGEKRRDKTDTFYLALALSVREKEILLEGARKLLSEVIPELNFSELLALKFVGDATFFQFTENMFVEIRRSGTDAKMRGYAGGPEKKRCQIYLDKLLRYSGERTELYLKTIPKKFQGDIYPLTQKIYEEYLYQGL